MEQENIEKKHPEYLVNYRCGYYMLYRNISDICYKFEKYLDECVSEEMIRKSYPEVEIRYDIKGSLYVLPEAPEYKEGLFKSGEYEGEPILTCTAYDYMCWYYTLKADDDEKKWIEIAINGAAKMYIISDGKVYTKSAFYRKEMMEDKAMQRDELIQNREPLEFVAKKNLDINGTITIFGLTYVFPKYHISTYMGTSYGLPVLDGHPTVFKNKILTVLDYDVRPNDPYTILVKQFKIESIKSGEAFH